MSRWTHLAGIVRIDHFTISLFDKFDEDEVIKVFKENMPRGSEGPPLFHTHRWPRKEIADHDWNATDELSEGSLYWGDFYVSADLRDKGDTDDDVLEIIGWFKKACLKLVQLHPGTMIRQAILQIEVEYKKTTLLSLTEALTDEEDMKNWHILSHPPEVQM